MCFFTTSTSARKPQLKCIAYYPKWWNFIEKNMYSLVRTFLKQWFWRERQRTYWTAEKIWRCRAARIDENSGQTFLKLSIDRLNVTPMTISKHLHAIRKIHKEGRWLSHEMSENAILNRLSIATSLFARQRKKFFVAHRDWWWKMDLSW